MNRFIAMGVLLLAATAHGEIVTETDGTVVEGKIEKTESGWNVTQDDGKVIFVQTDKVASIAPGHGKSDAAQSQGKLASLRRTVSQMSDLQQIIAKYSLFISQDTDQQTRDDAKADLAQWNDRQQQGLVKLGDKWITTAERESRRRQGQTEALGALDLMRQGRKQEGQTLLQQAVVDDPQNWAALFIQGVTLYNDGQLDKSQKAFEAANAAAPSNGPTLNNLGVIATRQHSFLPSINYYEQAMLAAPQTREILDNVAEALNSTPPAYRSAPILGKTVATFQAQDLLMQQAEARVGLFRWGSSWATVAEIKKLKEEQAAVQKQLDNLKSYNDDLQSKINAIDNDIDTNKRQMNQIQQANTRVDQTGNVITIQLPQSYYDIDTDNSNLLAKKKDLQAEQAEIRGDAKRIELQMPAAPFTGIQHLIGIEAVQQAVTPPADAPATQP